MKESGTESRQLKALRHRAEALLHEKPQALSDIPPEDIQQLIHELQVHQIELEMQNEELRRTQSKLAEARDKYFDLYEFAPVGYFTLDKNALVAEANLTGANLLAVDRRSLINSSFTRFIAPDFQDNFYFHRRQIVETATKQTCELKLIKNDGTEFYGLLESIAVPDAEGNFRQFRTAITDITQRKRAEDALRENKSTIQALIDATPESALLIDTKSNVLAINEMAAQRLGKSREGIIGRSAYDYLPPEVAQHRSEKLKQVLATGKQVCFSDEREGRHFYNHLYPVFNSKGDVEKVAIFAQDLAMQHQTELALHESVEKYRQLFESESNAVMIFDAETGQFEDANQATLNLYGYSKDEFLTLKVEDLSVEKKKTKSNVKKIRDGGVFPKQEPLRYLLKKDGTIFPGEVSATIFISNGRKKIIVVVRDITEHIRAEEALRESEERYRHLVDCARDIIYTVSSDTTILSMNPAIENMTGWSPSECTDKHLASFVHPDDFPLAMEMGQRALQGDKPPIHEVRILSKSGKYVLGEFSIAPFTQRGNVVGILGVGRDITIRKKLENALKHQAHKLIERVKELNCLFGISELLEKPGHSLDQILQGIVDLIPPGWQYPEITCAKLDLHKKIYATKDFKETIWKQACDIYVHGDLSGTLKVCYLEEKPSRDDEPFLKEEKKLLKSIAERVGKIVEGKQAHDALWESEQRFHELFNNMSNGVAVYKAVNDGEDFIFVDFNKAGERIDNFKRETLIGKSLLEIYPGAMEFGLFDVLQRVWSTGNSEQTPVIIYKDSRFSGWRENYAYKLPSGEIVAVYDDITDRIQAQEAMRKSETRYRALSEATFEAIFISEKGVCLDANQRAAELFGYDYNELIGIFGTDVIAPDSKELVEQNMLSGYERPYEAIAQKKDGSQFYVELRGKMMRYGDKDVRITIIRDINDQKQAAEALRKSEKRYRDLFNSIPIGLYRTTPEGSILDVNATMLEILGYPDRNTLLQAKALETYVDPDDRKQFQLLLEEQGFAHDFTVRLCRHDGKSIWVSINTTMVHDSDRQITYYKGAMADISARKASEEQIHELSQQLMQAQEDERQMISHELHDTVGQDLSVAKMACDLIYNELLNKWPPEAHRIKEICEALQKTILDVRNMAYDLRPPVLEELGLVEAIYRFCEDFTQMWDIPVDFQSAGLKNLKLDYAIQINLYRLVQEGLTNIRKHAAAGRVTLKLAAAFPNIILRIEDNGRGFDVQARAAAAGQAKRMGLRSMQERATLLNGKMNLQSKRGRGTKVIIKLPFEEKKSGEKENHLNR
jgi:PAS domain S-box-containing protein